MNPMRKLIYDRHPDIDQLWPRIEKLAYKLCARIAKKRKIPPDSLFGTAYIVVNHLLYKHKPDHGKFSTLLMFCGERIIDDVWTMFESERNAFVLRERRKDKPREAEFLPVRESDRTAEPEEISEEYEIVRDCGNFWKYVTEGLNEEQRNAFLLYYKDAMKQGDVAKAIKAPRKRTAFILNVARERVRRRLMELPSVRAYA